MEPRIACLVIGLCIGVGLTVGVMGDSCDRTIEKYQSLVSEYELKTMPSCTAKLDTVNEELSLCNQALDFVSADMRIQRVRD